MYNFHEIIKLLNSNFFSSLFGAFFGAGFAFSLSYRKSMLKKKELEKTALLETKYILLTQAQTLINVKKELDTKLKQEITPRFKIIFKGTPLELKDFLDEGFVNWLDYGGYLIPYKNLRIKLNKLLFLTSKNTSNEIQLLDKIANCYLNYPTVHLLLEKRQKIYNDFLTKIHELIKTSPDRTIFLESLTSDSEILSLLKDGSDYTVDLFESFTRFGNEAKQCVHEIDKYSKSRDFYSVP